MKFHGILFIEDKRPSEEMPYFFKDLNLDQIVEHITIGKTEYNLKPFFYTPLTNREEILYRQEVVQDLKKKGFIEEIENFSRKMRTMRRYLKEKKRAHHSLQKERWHLDAVDTYLDAVLTLEKTFSSFHPKSRGLSDFYKYLKGYIDSEKFKTLSEETKKLKELLLSVKYTILIKGNKVRVQKYKGEKDYAVEIEETFGRFRKGKVKNYALSFHDDVRMNHIEEKILELVAKLYDDIFSTLYAYCEKNEEFLDSVIGDFDREIQFYVAYLVYTDYLRREGLSFSLPEITDSREEIFVYGGFDMALAYKLKMEKKGHVVCNDFSLKNGERIMVVTGPNQGGKTTFARMVGQIYYFSLLGLPVPGIRARLFLIDNIFTHFERKEEIKDLRGKLEDDLVRINAILKKATEKSLIIMNEIFSSTTMEDALSLGSMVLRKILSLDASGILVTFLDELSSLEKGIVSMVAMVDPDEPTVRTYKIMRKKADGLSYALSLAAKYKLTYNDIKKRLKNECISHASDERF